MLDSVSNPPPSNSRVWSDETTRREVQVNMIWVEDMRGRAPLTEEEMDGGVGVILGAQ
jgi:hypothetical protein